MISDNLTEVRQEIARHAALAGREPGEITLIAVSKTKPASMVVEAFEAGQTVFGENKVQEMCEKNEQLSDLPLSWHLIGHLQSNKAKKAVAVADMIHSVDSVSLAQTINKYAAAIGKVQDILLEINVAQEESKFGLTRSDAGAAVREIAGLPNVRLRGFMTVAPYTENAEENRGIFRKSIHIFVICVPVLRLRNTPEQTEGILTFLQTHAVYIRRYLHNINHTLRKS